MLCDGEHVRPNGDIFMASGTCETKSMAWGCLISIMEKMWCLRLV